MAPLNFCLFEASFKTKLIWTQTHEWVSTVRQFYTINYMLYTGIMDREFEIFFNLTVNKVRKYGTLGFRTTRARPYFNISGVFYTKNLEFKFLVHEKKATKMRRMNL